VATAYVTLQAGVYVVPVYYTDIATTYNQTALAARYLAVTNAFWTVPTTCIENGDVNSIWHQADVQFHLVGNNSFLESSSNVVTATCTRSFPWHTVTTAVDLYGVETIDGVTTILGYGACRTSGFVAVASPQLNQMPALLGKSELIAHEFGHYLGNLGESTGYNLMNNGCCANVLGSDITQMGQLIAQKVYTNPNNDYIKNQ